MKKQNIILSKSLALQNVNAKRNDGNILEVAARISVTAASHSNGFGGVNSIAFLENYVNHCDQTEEAPFPLNLGATEHLSGLLGQIIIPYLGPDGNKWPTELIDMSEFGIYASNYNRCADLSQVDGYFDILVVEPKACFTEENTNSPFLYGQKSQCITEQKNREEAISLGQQCDILTTSLTYQFALHITTCLQLTDFRENQQLLNLACDKSLNVYIVQKNGVSKEIEVYPFHEVECPTSICIVHVIQPVDITSLRNKKVRSDEARKPRKLKSSAKARRQRKK